MLPYRSHSIWRSLLFVLLGCFSVHLTYATHNRAGEITYEQIDDLTIRVTITTYTKTSSFQADRDSLQINWGDGTSSDLQRANGNGDILPNDIKRNFYIGVHTYPGRGTYKLSMTDPNRIANIKNVNYPNSIKIQFHIETTISLLGTQFQGYNSSAILLQPPIDYACVGERFIHNPNAYDPDGDSLSYELIVPLEREGEEVPNYLYPDAIEPGNDNKLTLNPVTGEIIWDAPQQPGDYNIAFKIHEYRQGRLLNSIIRDMQILVEDKCNNEPPQIISEQEICVIAGDTLSFDVLASDPDMPLQQLNLTALGGPFETAVSPATFTPSGGYRSQPVSARFEWLTQCEHITTYPYSVVFKAVDDYNDTTGLATLSTLRIKVLGPPPENLTAISQQNGTLVSWDKPYACEVTEDEYFRGFVVWRKETSSPFIPDTCTAGLEGRGYTPIAYSIKDFMDGRYQYLDQEAVPGTSYCYRVTGTFALLSPGGQVFNLVHSIPSNEDCAGLRLNKPFITQVSILHTDPTAGEISVQWVKPSTSEIDTNIFGGPYRFILARGIGFNPATFDPVPGADFTSATFGGLVDTSFYDLTGLNTRDEIYSYQVSFYAGGQLYSKSDPASTVRLSAASNDKSIILSWEAVVPWQNYTHRIFRQSPGQTDFIFVGTSSTPNFTDVGLINGQEYCYYVETEGSYGFTQLPSPLLNLSQIICQTPEDLLPSCIPVASVQNSCDNPNLLSGGIFINRVTWNLGDNCEDPSDVSGYRVYFKPHIDTAFVFLAEVTGSVTRYDHESVTGQAGCYGVTSLDSLGNESDTSQVVCVNNCPFFQLPNVFTPNGDGANDVFLSYPYQFIDHVDMKIFNRWGQLVYQTTNPDIEWDGTNLTGKELADGVYSYICEVFESRSDGASQSFTVLQGFIELLR
ncbi:MAG: gliding motility-associated C-terminal domain-containing protein [Saprospiraceae bacterium]|nr:gliding motility-associated C-terminal domain-containing protein [Saprospiraceae bacterium]